MTGDKALFSGVFERSDCSLSVEAWAISQISDGVAVTLVVGAWMTGAGP